MPVLLKPTLEGLAVQRNSLFVHFFYCDIKSRLLVRSPCAVNATELKKAAHSGGLLASVILSGWEASQSRSQREKHEQDKELLDNSRGRQCAALQAGALQARRLLPCFISPLLFYSALGPLWNSLKSRMSDHASMVQ